MPKAPPRFPVQDALGAKIGAMTMPRICFSTTTVVRVCPWILVLTLSGFGCALGATAPEIPGDVLIVTLDTARADHFSYTGNSPVLTASTDRVAAEGAAFLSAVAPSPITLVSHASLFTGQDPFSHGVRNNGEFQLAQEAVTLAEKFRDQGRSTAAFVSAAVVDARYGLDQGFDVYDDNISGTDATGMFSYARRGGDEVVAAALRWLDRAQGQTFVWVHLFDPHAPYDPPEPERSRYAGHLYRGAVAFADRQLGVLLDGYRRLGRYDTALIVVTSDHGESLGEHGEQTHGVFVYDATVRVPLVMRGPGIESGVRIRRPVALTDVYPTLLGLAGLTAPNGIEGRDLGPLLRGEAARDGDRAIYVESLLPLLNFGWSPLYGLRSSRFKVIHGAETEVYDLEADPDELNDLRTSSSDEVNGLSSRLTALVAQQRPLSDRRLDLEAGERQKLQALGYLAVGDGVAALSSDTALPDPRQRIQVMERMFDAMTRFADGDPDGAIADLEDLVTEEPDNFSAWASLGELRFRLGDWGGAAKAWGRAARSAPENPRYAELEGLALERSGDFGLALEAVDRALAIEPRRASSRQLRWRLLDRLERRGELRAELEQAVADDPNDGMAQLLLIYSTHGRNSTPELIAALEAALEVLSGDLALTAALAAAVGQSGDLERAELLYRQVLAERPGDFAASVLVSARALAAGDVDEARRVAEAGVRKNPERPEMQLTAARARMADGDYQAAREALVRAYQLRPGWAETWLAAGELGILEGLEDQAAANLDRAADAAGDDPELLRRIRDANRRLGRDSEIGSQGRR